MRIKFKFNVFYLPAVIASLATVAVWRFVRCGDSIAVVGAGGGGGGGATAAVVSSSTAWFSSAFDDEAGFLPRADWRVDVGVGVTATVAFALPRGVYL